MQRVGLLRRLTYQVASGVQVRVLVLRGWIDPSLVKEVSKEYCDRTRGDKEDPCLTVM